MARRVKLAQEASGPTAFDRVAERIGERWRRIPMPKKAGPVAVAVLTGLIVAPLILVLVRAIQAVIGIADLPAPWPWPIYGFLAGVLVRLARSGGAIVQYVRVRYGVLARRVEAVFSR